MQTQDDDRPRQYTARQRREFVALHRKGDLTHAAFAKAHKLKLTTFRQWLYRRHPARPVGRPVLQEMHLPLALVAPGAAVEILVGPEITLRLKGDASPAFIAQLVQQMRGLC